MIHTFTNKPHQNIFNQNYKYFMFEKNYSGEIKPKKLASFILKKEKKIIKDTQKEFESINKKGWQDGGTGLGTNSLTSRSPLFNLVEFKETKYLKKIIKNAHLDFMKELNLTYKDNLYIQCWANVMRKGDKIKKHFHSVNNFDYLSGHICIQTKDTNTYYLEPYYKEMFSLKNIPGNITLFPSWVEHFTDEVLNDNERITIAFDLRNTDSMQDIYPHMKQHWSKI
tara:strand:- start:45 stop:719 length:675 start_codon:yes stop_codon:yes gene_type:complete